MPKDAVRALARELLLAIADKPDSQDICFVPDGDYAAIVKRVRPEAAEPGEIVDLDGVTLGTHTGLVHFTVGQRRGLDLGGRAEPLYVVRLDPERRRVVVGPRAALATHGARLDEVNLLAEPAGRDLHAKVRSMARPVPVLWTGDGVRFAAPEYGVAPGQAAVLYEGERVIGGGWIADTEPAELQPA